MTTTPELLSTERAAMIAATLDSGQFNDGNATTGNATAGLKHNLELAADATRKELGELVLGAVRALDTFAAVFWIQSHVREAPRRAVLMRLNDLCRRLADSGLAKSDQDLASCTVHDLLRMRAA